MSLDISPEQIPWNTLAEAAWKCRNQAYIIGKTKVGAALITDTEGIFVGCNVEHKYRCHDVHAEVNAITNMVSFGHTKVIAIIVVAEHSNFTPCGGCMDWILQFGGESCLVAIQSQPGGEIHIFQASELMPHYPGSKDTIGCKT
jgi:cytidine deaminase